MGRAWGALHRSGCLLHAPQHSSPQGHWAVSLQAAREPRVQKEPLAWLSHTPPEQSHMLGGGRFELDPENILSLTAVWAAGPQGACGPRPAGWAGSFVSPSPVSRCLVFAGHPGTCLKAPISADSRGLQHPRVHSDCRLVSGFRWSQRFCSEPLPVQLSGLASYPTLRADQGARRGPCPGQPTSEVEGWPPGRGGQHHCDEPRVLRVGLGHLGPGPTEVYGAGWGGVGVSYPSRGHPVGLRLVGWRGVAGPRRL